MMYKTLEAEIEYLKLMETIKCKKEFLAAHSDGHIIISRTPKIIEKEQNAFLMDLES